MSGEILITGDWSGAVSTYNLATRQPRGCWVAHDAIVSSIEVEGETGAVLTASEDGTVVVWRSAEAMAATPGAGPLAAASARSQPRCA